MKRIVAVLFVITLLLSLTGCGEKPTLPENEAASTPNADSQPMSDITTPDLNAQTTVGKTTPCTDAEIKELIAKGNLLFDEQLSMELLTRSQRLLPEDVLTCINEHIGAYRVYKLSGAEGELNVPAILDTRNLNN